MIFMAGSTVAGVDGGLVSLVRGPTIHPNSLEQVRSSAVPSCSVPCGNSCSAGPDSRRRYAWQPSPCRGAAPFVVLSYCTCRPLPCRRIRAGRIRRASGQSRSARERKSLFRVQVSGVSCVSPPLTKACDVPNSTWQRINSFEGYLTATACKPCMEADGSAQDLHEIGQ